jgi:hypothetical protein
MAQRFIVEVNAHIENSFIRNRKPSLGDSHLLVVKLLLASREKRTALRD